MKKILMLVVFTVISTTVFAGNDSLTDHDRHVSHQVLVKPNQTKIMTK